MTVDTGCLSSLRKVSWTATARKDAGMISLIRFIMPELRSTYVSADMTLIANQSDQFTRDIDIAIMSVCLSVCP